MDIHPLKSKGRTNAQENQDPQTTPTGQHILFGITRYMERTNNSLRPVGDRTASIICSCSRMGCWPGTVPDRYEQEISKLRQRYSDMIYQDRECSYCGCFQSHVKPCCTQCGGPLSLIGRRLDTRFATRRTTPEAIAGKWETRILEASEKIRKGIL